MSAAYCSIIDRLRETHALSEEGYLSLMQCSDAAVLDYLRQSADEVRRSVYGTTIYVRGLIEFTNYCKNDCLYCGIRRSNRCAERFRLEEADILGCAEAGYRLGFRTFVLQGGEDPYFDDKKVIDLVSALRKTYPDCAITLSIGEKPRESYQAYFDAGADRYLLRHETASAEHYGRLHPPELSLRHRMECLEALKEIGYQVGCGFMVGSPYQTPQHIVQDLKFVEAFRPHMVGIGPFIPHKDTPFGSFEAGSAQETIKLLSIIRLMLPNVLLPATTALGTIAGDGREKGILAGANVIMPNLSPPDARKKYMLYNDKLSAGEEAAEHLLELKRSMVAIGYEIVTDRGDYKG